MKQSKIPTKIRLRSLCEDDYPQLFALWQSIEGFGIRMLDDSEEGVRRFIRRNPDCSVAAVLNGRLVGAILCGHDGRQASLYHVCVAPGYRKHGIGEAMVQFCLEALRREKIHRACLVAFDTNEAGNAFWQRLGWQRRDDLRYYQYIINPANTTHFVARLASA